MASPGEIFRTKESARKKASRAAREILMRECPDTLLSLERTNVVNTPHELSSSGSSNSDRLFIPPDVSMPPTRASMGSKCISGIGNSVSGMVGDEFSPSFCKISRPNCEIPEMSGASQDYEFPIEEIVVESFPEVGIPPENSSAVAPVCNSSSSAEDISAYLPLSRKIHCQNRQNISEMSQSPQKSHVFEGGVAEPFLEVVIPPENNSAVAPVCINSALGGVRAVYAPLSRGTLRQNSQNLNEDTETLQNSCLDSSASKGVAEHFPDMVASPENSSTVTSMCSASASEGIRAFYATFSREILGSSSQNLSEIQESSQKFGY